MGNQKKRSIFGHFFMLNSLVRRLHVFSIFKSEISTLLCNFIVFLLIVGELSILRLEFYGSKKQANPK
jgi:hypothetical protein